MSGIDDWLRIALRTLGAAHLNWRLAALNRNFAGMLLAGQGCAGERAQHFFGQRKQMNDGALSGERQCVRAVDIACEF
jgi:hypothetical protein